MLHGDAGVSVQGWRELEAALSAGVVFASAGVSEILCFRHCSGIASIY